MWVPSRGQKDPLEEGMATLSSILAWRILWAEEPDRLQFIGSERVGHDWSNLACARLENPLKVKVLVVIPTLLTDNRFLNLRSGI